MPHDPFFGATGKFPEGKIDSSDDGELQFGVGRHNGNVVINFGEPVLWIGLTPDIARQLAAAIIQQADLVEGKAAE